MAKTEFEHPAIDQMIATPEILRLIMAPLSDEQAMWKPAPDRWSAWGSPAFLFLTSIISAIRPIPPMAFPIPV